MPQSRRQSIVMITSAVLAALALAPSVSAQEDGTISGTVRDATDAVLPGVTVEVRSTAAGGAVQTAITDVIGVERPRRVIDFYCTVEREEATWWGAIPFQCWFQPFARVGAVNTSQLCNQGREGACRDPEARSDADRLAPFTHSPPRTEWQAGFEHVAGIRRSLSRGRPRSASSSRDLVSRSRSAH